MSAYTFTYRDQTYELPPAQDSAGKVPGGISIDAIMAPSDNGAQMRLALAMLQCSAASPDSLAALNEMPTEDMLLVVAQWMNHRAEPQDATLPES